MANSTGKLDKFIMKKSNRQLIFSMIIRSEAVSRVQLAQMSNMSVMSVGRIADELIEQGLIVEEDDVSADARVGRRPKLLRASSDTFLSVGVEMYRDGINVGIINLKGQILHQIKYLGDLSAGPVQTVLETVAGLIHQVITDNRDLQDIASVGIACPGLIENGVIHFSSQLKWKDVPIVSELQKLTGIKNIFIDNEVKSRAVAEDLFGAGKPYKSSVVLDIGSGVGSAAVINHELYRGKKNMAGEIGHICISHDGNMCECGRQGCLQTYIADWAILREARAVRESITLDGVFEAYLSKEPWAMSVIHRVLDNIAVTISILANTYAPEVIILCGSLIENYTSFRTVILNHYKNDVNEYALSSFYVVPSDFNSDGTLIGAATLAYYNLLDQMIWTIEA